MSRVEVVRAEIDRRNGSPDQKSTGLTRVRDSSMPMLGKDVIVEDALGNRTSVVEAMELCRAKALVTQAIA